MIFGNSDAAALEIGEIAMASEQGKPFVRIRFALVGEILGDWNTPIPLTVAVGNMKTFLACRDFRRDTTLTNTDAAGIFAATFTAFYKYDYETQPVLNPNLRDRYHLSEVGGDSVSDKYGIVVAEVGDNISRVVAMDLQTDCLLIDETVSSEKLEKMGAEFINWGERVLER